MAWTKLFHKDGSDSYRDQTYLDRGEPLDARLVTWIHAVSGFDERTRRIKRKFKWIGMRELDSIGDFITPTFYPPHQGIRVIEPVKRPDGSTIVIPKELEKPRPVGAWSAGMPIMGVDVKSSPFSWVLPVYDKTGVPDTRFDPIPSFLFTTPEDKPIRPGQWGMMFGLTKEHGEIERVVFPFGDPLIAANNPSVDAKKSSVVYDLVPGKSTLSDTDKAPLNSFWQVVQPFYSPSGLKGLDAGLDSTSTLSFLGLIPKPGDTRSPGLAWHIGGTPYEKWGHGLVMDFGKLGFIGKSFGGPLLVGDGRDGEKHYIGDTFDSEPEMSCHLSTDSLFYRSAEFDAPLKFEGYYECDEPLPYYVRAHIRYDPCEDHSWLGEKREGFWKIQVESDTEGSQKDCNEDEDDADDDSGEGEGGGIVMSDSGAGVTTPSLEPEGGTITGPTEIPDPDPSISPIKPKPRLEEPNCYDLLEERRKATSDPNLPKFAKWENKTGNFVGQESYRYTPFRKAHSELLGKPHPTLFYSVDLRDYTLSTIPEMKPYYKSYKKYAPITSRRVFFGGINGSEYEYTQRFDNPSGRFISGSGPGGEILMPAEIDIADIRLQNEAGGHVPEISSGSVSPLSSGIVPGGKFFFGYPNLLNGQIYSDAVVKAWSIYIDTSNNLKFDQYASGSATTQLTFPNTGSDYFLFNKAVHSNDSFYAKNGSFWGRIVPTTLGADRTYTLPNQSGTIALTSDIPAPSTSYWDYSSNYLKTNVQVDVLAIENSAGDIAEINIDGITAGRSFDLPNQNGTFKLKKNLFAFGEPAGGYSTTYQNQRVRVSNPSGATVNDIMVEFPKDMATLIAVRIYVIPVNTNASANIDFSCYYGGDGTNALNAFSGSDTTSTYSLTAGQPYAFDITSIFGSAVAGQKGTVTLTNNMSAGSPMYLFRVETEYTPTA